jgi:hypothetical protein
MVIPSGIDDAAVAVWRPGRDLLRDYSPVAGPHHQTHRYREGGPPAARRLTTRATRYQPAPLHQLGELTQRPLTQMVPVLSQIA